MIWLHGAAATADGVAARLTRTVILAFALSLSVFFVIGIGFGTAFALDFAFDFAFAFVLWCDSACARSERVCNFFLGPESLAEPYSSLGAVRWIFSPIDFFDSNRTQTIAVGIAPLIEVPVWKSETAACDIVFQPTKIAVLAARDLVLLGHLNTIKAAVHEDERWIK